MRPKAWRKSAVDFELQNEDWPSDRSGNWQRRRCLQVNQKLDLISLWKTTLSRLSLSQLLLLYSRSSLNNCVFRLYQRRLFNQTFLVPSLALPCEHEFSRIDTFWTSAAQLLRLVSIFSNQTALCSAELVYITHFVTHTVSPCGKLFINMPVSLMYDVIM